MTPSVPLTFSNAKTSWVCTTIPSRSSKLTMPLPKKIPVEGIDLAPASHWWHAGFLSARLPAFDDKRGCWD
jgi:hypothetical protein